MKRTIHSISELMILLLCLTTWAQAAPVRTCSVNGAVMDDPFPMKRASMPVGGTMVRVWAPLYVITTSPAPSIPLRQLVDSTVTDKAGQFTFTALPAGTYQITFDHVSCNSRTLECAVTADTSMTVLVVPAGAHARVAGTVWAACSNILGMPCILTPVSGCTVTVVTQSSYSFFRAVTDTQGQYAIDSVPVSVNGEMVPVSAVKTGFVQQTIDSSVRNTMATTVNFSLAKSATGTRDTVSVTPPQPTTRDSLTFTLQRAAHCCATVFRNKTVSANDSLIYLSYTYDDSLCSMVDCITGSSQTVFSSGPVKAGAYSIYFIESAYCPPGTPCPLSITAPVLVGKITVTTPSGIGPERRVLPAGPGQGLVVSGPRAWVSLAHSAIVSLDFFNARGVHLGTAYRGFLFAGRYGFDLRRETAGKSAAKGTMVLRLSVNGTVTASRTVIQY